MYKYIFILCDWLSGFMFFSINDLSVLLLFDIICLIIILFLLLKVNGFWVLYWYIVRLVIFLFS